MNGFRLTAAAAILACLLFGSLKATPTANAASTGTSITTSITTPTDPTFLIGDNDQVAQTFAISGTSDGTTGDQVDINCYRGTTWTSVASSVAINADGSFSVPTANLRPLEDGPCTLRAVPAGTTPSDLTPFLGPRIGVGERDTKTLPGGSNAGQAYDYYIWAQQLTGAFDYLSAGSCGLADGLLYDTTLNLTTTTFYCNDGLFNYEQPIPTRSELQIDGTNAYTPYGAEQINPDATGFPALSYSYSVDPATGNLVIHETDPLVVCPDQTYPPTATTCASFVSAGVTDNRTIAQDHDGQIAWISDVFTSTDGKAHTLDLLWDNTQRFQNGNADSSKLEYEFPGESAFSTHATGDSVSLPASPGTILVRMHGAADGDPTTGQGAIIYDRPATGAKFTAVTSGYSDLTVHQTGTVPAGGSTRFRSAYVQDYHAADVASLAETASSTFADTLLNTLSVAKAGPGSGTVSSSPGGIDCGATCSQGYSYGTPVTLTATPATGSTFTGWSGACSGSGGCTVTTNDAVSVTAHFGVAQETLSVVRSGTGSGTVSSSPAGISCGSTCSHAYDYGSSVSLIATPSPGSAFTGWSGACSGTGSCTVTTNKATSATATFSLVPETLTVTSKGDGAGAVTSSPAGISCGATCTHTYSYGTTISLAAQAARGSAFVGWSGACSGTNACTLVMKAGQSVQATFVKDCLVPQLKGKSLNQAKAALKNNECSLGKARHAFSRKVKKGHILSQKPKPGTQLKHLAAVNLVVSKGSRP